MQGAPGAPLGEMRERIGAEIVHLARTAGAASLLLPDLSATADHRRSARDSFSTVIGACRMSLENAPTAAVHQLQPRFASALMLENISTLGARVRGPEQADQRRMEKKTRTFKPAFLARSLDLPCRTCGLHRKAGTSAMKI
jgi:hypothetical protein